MRRTRTACCLLFVLFGAAGLTGCNSCGKREPPRKVERAAQAQEAEAECVESAECDDENPCTVQVCQGGVCVASPAPEGTSCEDGDVCNGVARCDAAGRCVAGPPPAVDDGNACTTDGCDPVRGVTHAPAAVDDSDACTTDACDPRSGEVTHAEVDIDDHDDCTFDSCDPKRGVDHRRATPTYTCAASCGSGFHAAGRTPSAECGSATALRTFCLPDCGPSFHTCDAQCPTGYQKKSEARSTQCGASSPTMAFCVKG